MAPRRRRNAANNQEQDHDRAQDQEQQQQAGELRRRGLTLFIQQVEKEVQERLRDMEAKLEHTMAMVDRAFKVELMKVPPVRQKTRIGDLISEKELLSISEVSIVMKNGSLEMQQPLKRVSSKKAKSSQTTPVNRTSKTSKGGKGTKRSKTLVGSSSTGDLGCASAPAKRTQSRLLKSQTKPKLRSVVSTGDINCSMAGAAAHISVTTGLGQTVSFSEETKEDMDFNMLDDVAWHHLQRLTSLMEEISKRRLK